MPAYWIKLYTEILDDPKMGTLPEILCWRFVQLCLVAGRMEQEGDLPPTPQLAWVLRLNTDDLEHDLQQLASIGLVARTITGWLVVNFAKRQSPVPDFERMRQMRERKQKQQYYEDVTKSNIETESDTETETEAESDTPDAFTLMQRTVERMTGYPMLQSDIGAINEFVAKGVIEADIADSLAFFKDKTVIHGAEQMRKSVMLAVARRTQAKHAARSKPGAANPPAVKQDPAQVEAMRKALQENKHAGQTVAE